MVNITIFGDKQNFMRKIALMALILSGSLCAQVKYSFSEAFEIVKKHEDLGLYKLDNNKYAEIYYRKDEDIVLQLYDDKFVNVIQQETAPFPEESKRSVEGNLRRVKNDYFWFYSTWDKKKKIDRLFALPFNKNTLKFDKKEVKLVETNNRIDDGGGLKYEIHCSNDSSKLLIIYRIVPEEKRDRLNKDIIGFNLFDSQMKKIYAAEIEMPYNEADMDNIDYEIDSKGNIYILARVKLNNEADGEKSKENKDVYRYELIRINQHNNTLQSIKMGLDGRYSRSVGLSEDLKGDIVIVGYYSNKKKSTGPDGAYVTRLELDDQSAVKNLNTSYCEFPAEALKAYESQKEKEKMDKKDKNDDLEAANLNFSSVVFNNDGSMLIVGEEISYVYHYSSGNSARTSETYYYNDIIALKIGRDGKTQWCRKIPKRQTGFSWIDLSYYLHKNKDDYYFFYIDNIKNADIAITETPEKYYSGSGGYLTCVKMDGNGKMTKQSIIDIKTEDLKIYPGNFKSANENMVLDRLRMKEDREHSKMFKLEIK